MALCVLLNTDHGGGIWSLCPLHSLLVGGRGCTRGPAREDTAVGVIAVAEGRGCTRGPAREDSAVGVIAVAEGLVEKLSTVEVDLHGGSGLND